MKIYIVGIGMDGRNTITAEAMKAVENSDVLIGAERMTKPFEYLQKPVQAEWASSKISRYIAECGYSTVAVLMSGDCGFYSGAKKLLSLLPEYETEIISGISSPVYFCSKLGIDWSDLNFVSLHGKSGNIVRNVCRHEKTFFLLGGALSAGEVCTRLCEYGMNGISVYIGENLAYPDERILSGKAEEFTEFSSSLCVMIAENPDFERFIRSGIPDGEFIRGKVPITKPEIRNICVSALEIGENNICWDIGSGTGSVSVEMALRCINGTVFAVEKNPEAVSLTEQNRKKFGCDNIETVQGEALKILENLPVPDCVFIGGSGGQLREIIVSAYEKNPAVRLVITAVSLETLNSTTEIFDSLGLIPEVKQIAVTRTGKIGNHTMFSAENPVFIIKREFQ